MLLLNLRHYFGGALWGVGQSLDPDYGTVDHWISREPVLEHRTYGLLPLWAVALVVVLPPSIVAALCAFWVLAAWRRAGFYRSEVEFWRRAVAESPGKQRCQDQLAAALMRKAEDEMKSGGAYDVFLTEAAAIYGKNPVLFRSNPQ